MDMREAKHMACAIVAARIEQAMDDPALFPEHCASGDDHARLQSALAQLHWELSRRAGERNG